MKELAPEATSLAIANGAEKLCAYIYERKNEIMDYIQSVNVTADNWKSQEVKDALNLLKTAIEDLREKGKKLVEASCAATDMQRVLSQIDSRLWSFKAKAEPLCVYSILSNAYAELKAKVDEFKAKAEPPKPKHTYVIRLTCDDAALAKVCKAAEKAGAEGLFYATAQSDKAVKQIVAWFEANA